MTKPAAVVMSACLLASACGGDPGPSASTANPPPSADANASNMVLLSHLPFPGLTATSVSAMHDDEKVAVTANGLNAAGNWGLTTPAGRRFALTGTSADKQNLVIDYAILYVKKSGETSRKVFKLRQLELSPAGTLELSRNQTLKNFTTRVHYSGRHGVELLVNGECLARSYFDLAC